MTMPDCYKKLHTPSQEAENGCHDCHFHGDCKNHREFEMKKKTERVSQVTPITAEWIDMVIATTVGPNIALYSMYDAEGEARAEQFKAVIRTAVTKAYTAVSEGPTVNREAFVKTVQSIIMEQFGKFCVGRFTLLLKDGMPAKPVIIKPH